jgi:hypothetical protein
LAANYIPSNGIAQPVQLGVNVDSPNALAASTGSNVLWALDDSTGGPDYVARIYNFTDTLYNAAPALSGPADKASVSVNPMTGATDAVILSWGRAANASSHNVRVAYDSAFSQTILNTSYTWSTASVVIGGNSATTLLAGKTYYWKVRADGALNSPWSEVRTFTVQPMAAGVPAIASPANGATISNQAPAFSWAPVTGTTKYEFQLSNYPAFAVTLYSDMPASAGTQVPVTMKLEQGTQYFWRVRALEPVQSDWSAVANFMVATPAAPPAPPVTVTSIPAPTLTIPPAPPAVTLTIPPAPVPDQIAPTYIWAIIIIGAILVIAVIVLIVRTRRSV